MERHFRIVGLRINWFLLLLIIRRSAEMHFRIAEQRIIPFLLQLIVRGSSKRRSKILILRIKQRGFSVPTARFIRSLKIRRPSNPAFAYKLVPFITYYTQIRRDTFQDCEVAYNPFLLQQIIRNPAKRLY